MCSTSSITQGEAEDHQKLMGAQHALLNAHNDDQRWSDEQSDRVGLSISPCLRRRETE